MHRLFPISLFFLALILFRLGYVHGLIASTPPAQAIVPARSVQTPAVAMSTGDGSSTRPAHTATQQAQTDSSAAIDR